MTDKQRLNKLDEFALRYGWTVSESFSGKGLSLHETGKKGYSKTVREAIDIYINYKAFF